MWRQDLVTVIEKLPDQTALIVAFPEVESLVGPIRARHDPASAEGVPAHVTIVFPFLAPEKISPEIVQALTNVFSTLHGFRIAFAEVRRFSGVLYLAPSPEAPLRQLTEAVVARFPETPPYGGAFPDIIPHLTMAHAESQDTLDEIATEFRRAAEGTLPIHATVNAVTLIEKTHGTWRSKIVFALGHRS